MVDAFLTRVVVTGACSDIGLQLSSRIARGNVLGPDSPVHIVLVDKPNKLKQLKKGTAIELGMCNHQLLHKTTCTSNLEEAFTGADIIFLISGVQHVHGYTRSDIICINAVEYKEVGLALNKVEMKPTVKILVMAESPNLLLSVITHYAPDLPRANITGLSRTDQNKATAYIARKLNIATNKVRNLAVWGIGSPNLVIDVRHAEVEICGETFKARDAIKNDFFLKFKFTDVMRNRTNEIKKRLQSPPCMSVVSAAVQHMKDWLEGTKGDYYTSMVILSDGSYEIDKDIPFSFPVRVRRSKYEIVQGLDINFFEREQLDTCMREIQQERALVYSVLKIEETTGNEEDAPPPWSFGAREKIQCRILAPLEQERVTSLI